MNISKTTHQTVPNLFELLYIASKQVRTELAASQLELTEEQQAGKAVSFWFLNSKKSFKKPRGNFSQTFFVEIVG